MTRRSFGVDLRWGARWGLFGGTVYLGFAAVVVALAGGLEGSRLEHVRLPVLLGAYPVLGVVAGLIVGLFRPALKTRRGAMLVGVVAGFPAGVGFLRLAKGPIPSWDGSVWFGAVAGAILLGCMGGYILWGQLHGYEPDAALKEALARQGQGKRGRKSQGQG